MKKPGFTLVELVITITILVILSTIAFVSFQSYTKDSRDANRLASLNQLSNGLKLSFSKNGAYPTPESPVSLLASGTIIGYQGTIGSNLSAQIGLQSEAKDPLDKKYYTYRTDTSGEKYQILALLENDENALAFTPGVFAGYEKRSLKGLGDSLGILLDTSNTPIQELSLTGVDLVNTTTSYIFFQKDNSLLTGTGNVLKGGIGGGGIVGYWNFDNNSGSTFLDLTSSKNHGTIFSGATFTSTQNGGGVQISTSSQRASIPSLANTTYLTQTFSFGFNFIYNGTLSNEVNNSATRIIENNNYPKRWFVVDLSTNQIEFEGGVKQSDGSLCRNPAPFSYSLQNNTRYNIFFTLSSDKMLSLYINGQFIEKGKLIGNCGDMIFHDTSQNIQLTNRYSIISQIIFDDVRIYNRALSNTEIENISRAIE